MSKDIVEILNKYAPIDDETRWVKLSSTVHFRALELLLLKEILLELRDLNKPITGKLTEHSEEKGAPSG